MIIISRFKPSTSANIDSIFGAISQLQTLASNPADATGVFINECGPEVVAITKVANFAELDKVENDPKNLEIGLRLMKAGFVLASVDFLKEISGISHINEAFTKLQ